MTTEIENLRAENTLLRRDIEALNRSFVAQCDENGNLLRQIVALELRNEQLGDAVLARTVIAARREATKIKAERVERSERMSHGIQL